MKAVPSMGLIWKAFIIHRVPIGYAIPSPHLGHIWPISTGLLRGMRWGEPKLISTSSGKIIEVFGNTLAFSGLNGFETGT